MGQLECKSTLGGLWWCAITYRNSWVSSCACDALRYTGSWGRTSRKWSRSVWTPGRM